MNLVRLLGCILVGFGLPIAVIARFVVQRSVLFLLLVASAFWALAPTLLSSCLWIAIAPLKSSYVFHILFGVAFQEACRWAMLAGYIRCAGCRLRLPRTLRHATLPSAAQDGEAAHFHRPPGT